jgi:hypothetical protein
MKKLKWILPLSVTTILIAICAYYVLRPDFSHVDFAGLGAHLTSALMKPITKNLDGSSPIKIDPKAPEVYSRPGEIGTILSQRAEPLPMTSEGLSDVEPAKRLDPLGHPFCFMDLGDSIAVISPGPDQITAGCSELSKEIRLAHGLRAGILYTSSQDAWLVLVPRSPTLTHEKHVVTQSKSEAKQK